ncbi:hypothetical protein SFRURICE_010702 [Spodoptera frugiperda]|nr:hypothetical protein SFRURICE_010702 [Spodoptera frugiperda]
MSSEKVCFNSRVHTGRSIALRSRAAAARSKDAGRHFIIKRTNFAVLYVIRKLKALFTHQPNDHVGERHFECLKEHFVPMHLGLTHTNVQNVASRNRTIPEGLFGDSSMASDVKPAIVICDGTYVYVQSSSNYKYQKQTYSLHKYANLVKPFLITCCDGYILECTGPYEATKNDSTITFITK